MRLTVLTSIVLVMGSTAIAGDVASRPVHPVADWTVESLGRFDAEWLHVKFVEGTEVEFDDLLDRFVDAKGADLSQVDRVLAEVETVRRTFEGDRAKFQALKTQGEAASGRPGPDLSLWFDVRVANGRDGLAKTINALNALDAIEIAHPAPICETASIHTRSAASALCRAVPGLGVTPDFSAMQDYLYDTPVGLDAPAAWATPGGRGAMMKFIDVELGWAHTHEDFSQANNFLVSSNNDPSYEDHGTAVVGEVVGMDNGYGVTGFASDAQWGTEGITVGEWPTVPGYFMNAAEALDPGDVWLIELQMFPPGFDATPMEWLQVNYDVIWTSSWALDVVCVEAGANGSQNLDSPAWGGIFDRNVRDSGAIMVGAGTPVGRVAEWFTNYGSRMDVHAWGSQITTTGYGDLYDGGPDTLEYTDGFGGTSGASPMVVGSALCLQGIAKAELGGALTPPELRQLLNETGISHLGSDPIGPRPDLGAAVEMLLAGGCDADLDGSGTVNVDDMLIVLAGWATPAGDVDGDGTTNVTDLLLLLGLWGPC